MANATFLAEAQFTASKIGKTGLADVTVDVVEHNPAAGTDNTTFLVAQAATEVLHGLYRLYFTGDEDRIYTCLFATADATVDAKEIPALAVLLHRMGAVDADISSRLAPSVAGRTLVIDAAGIAQADLRAIEGALTSGNNAILKLAGLDIQAQAPTGLAINIVGGPDGGTAISILGGINDAVGGTGGFGITIQGGTGAGAGGPAVWLLGGLGTPMGNGLDISGLQDITLAGDGRIHGSIDQVNTGVTLAANQDVRNVSGSVAGNVVGSTGYVAGNVLGSLLGQVVGQVGSVAAPVTVGANNDKTGYALTSVYNAAKTAASQTSVDDIPTNAEHAAAMAAGDDAVLAAIAALNNLSSAGAQAAAAAALAAYGAALEASAQAILTDTGTTLPAQINGVPAAVDAQLSGTHGAGAWGVGLGASSIVYTVTVDGLPREGVYCRMTSDATGLANVDDGISNALGQVTFHHSLPSGTHVYIWRTLAGVSFVNPDEETIP